MEDTAIIKIESSQFLNNSAQFQGGAIFSDSTQFSITNSCFDSNEAYIGAGVYISSISK